MVWPLSVGLRVHVVFFLKELLCCHEESLLVLCIG